MNLKQFEERLIKLEEAAIKDNADKELIFNQFDLLINETKQYLPIENVEKIVGESIDRIIRLTESIKKE